MSDRIIAALRGGDAAEARRLAETRVAEAPDDAEAHFLLALSLQSLGAGPDALSAIDAAIRLAPDRQDYGMTRSVMLLGADSVEQAQAGMLDALAYDPNRLQAYIGLMHIALSQHNAAEARRLLKLAERIDAENEHVLLAKGAILQAEGSLDDALKHFTRASEINPNSVLALSGLGMLYLRMRMPAFAEQALKRAYAAAPGNVTVLRGLLQSQLAQEQLEQAERTADEILRQAGDDQHTLFLRGQLRADRGAFGAAIEDARRLRTMNPEDSGFLTQLATWLINDGQREQANSELRSAVAASPHNEAFWQLLANFEMAVDGDVATVVGDWLERLPESGLAREILATQLERQGDFEAAGVEADKALARAGHSGAAQFIKLRQEIRDNPQAALARAEGLVGQARNPEAQRMILTWLGLIHDRLGRYAAAADAFRLMAGILLVNRRLPMFVSADGLAVESAVAGRLLWMPVGVRAEPVFDALSPVLDKRLLIDRNIALPARQDGFGPVRFIPGSPQAGLAAKWLSGLDALGVAAADAVDWIPHWDAYTATALQGTELLALVLDPRDAFLNWMVFGSAQAYGFPPDTLASAHWLALAFDAVADTIENGPQAVHAVKIDDLESDAQAIAGQLQRALGLEAAPDAGILGKPVLALGGMPNRFPAGHWRHYREAFAEAFAVLAPAARRLGYPQD